jgi:hypothetical protein
MPWAEKQIDLYCPTNLNFDEIKKLIKASNAFKFLQDPFKFLEGLDKVE